MDKQARAPSGPVSAVARVLGCQNSHTAPTGCYRTGAFGKGSLRVPCVERTYPLARVFKAGPPCSPRGKAEDLTYQRGASLVCTYILKGLGGSAADPQRVIS